MKYTYFLVSFHIFFSLIQNGLGFGLTNLAILALLLHFHVNLRTIKEPIKTRNSWISYSQKFTISFMLLTFFLAVAVPLSFLFTWNIYVLRIRNILTLVLASILIPKYFINANENLKLYVCVYHWVPAPILPWQLPKNYNLDTNKVIKVIYPNIELRKSLLFAKNIF